MVNLKKLNILAVSDLHYIGGADHLCGHEERHNFLGALAVRKALRRVRQDNLPVDLIILLGDLVDNGNADGAQEDLKSLSEEIKQSGKPVLAVNGNHDCSAAFYSDCFDCPEGIYEIGGYGFLVFNDDVAEGDFVTRPPRYFELLRELPDDLPLVALQHNPVYPDIDSKYPYMITNTEDIRTSYADSSVFLSLSGHYHCGQEAVTMNRVVYRTLPAMCESPFRFDYIQLCDTQVDITPMELKTPHEFLTDNHLHTQFAYCAETVQADTNIELSRLLGLKGITLTEHTFHLYFPNKAAWSMQWLTDPDMVKRAYADPENRISQYRRQMAQYRSDSVGIGLEVDMCADGGLLLAEEEREGWDLLVGAVHGLAAERQGQLTRAQAEKAFMHHTEKLVSQPIQVLAHPFRWFRRKKMECSVQLFAPLAELLAQAGVAAEINYHTNQPDARFVEECLQRGVKFSLGTDAHELAEVGDFYPHLKLLRQAGVADAQLREVLFDPFMLRGTSLNNT